jgi:hypothetical protein
MESQRPRNNFPISSTFRLALLKENSCRLLKRKMKGDSFLSPSPPLCRHPFSYMIQFHISGDKVGERAGVRGSFHCPGPLTLTLPQSVADDVPADCRSSWRQHFEGEGIRVWFPYAFSPKTGRGEGTRIGEVISCAILGSVPGTRPVLSESRKCFWSSWCSGFRPNGVPAK